MPMVKGQTSPPKLRQSASVASLLVHKVLLAPKTMRASNTARPRTPPPQRCSPQILITRALSQDQPDSPSKQREDQVVIFYFNLTSTVCGFMNLLIFIRSLMTPPLRHLFSLERAVILSPCVDQVLPQGLADQFVFA
jgi:hypothetical protein